jgi:hypothetical protein
VFSCARHCPLAGDLFHLSVQLLQALSFGWGRFAYPAAAPVTDLQLGTCFICPCSAAPGTVLQLGTCFTCLCSAAPGTALQLGTCFSCLLSCCASVLQLGTCFSCLFSCCARHCPLAGNVFRLSVFSCARHCPSAGDVYLLSIQLLCQALAFSWGHVSLVYSAAARDTVLQLGTCFRDAFTAVWVIDVFWNFVACGCSSNRHFGERVVSIFRVPLGDSISHSYCCGITDSQPLHRGTLLWSKNTVLWDAFTAVSIIGGFWDCVPCSSR